jgi:hypothetical protein
VRLSELRALAGEARGLGFALRDEVSIEHAGPIVVSGILAEQLAKELAAGAAPGSVLVGPAQPSPHASVHVHVVAGDPTDDDEALLRGASEYDVDVVIVELWPQPDWTRPFVLSPFVVECRAGEGFPIAPIAERIVEATENMTELASKVPVLADAARAAIVKRAVVRSALIGLVGSRLGASRPLLVREQALTLAKLRTVSAGAAVSDDKPVLAGGAAALFTSGLALRGLARGARAVLPAPVANAAIAATATWAFARAFRVLEQRGRLPGSSVRGREAGAV